MARPKVVHIKSNTLNKKPTTGQIDYGEIAVNYNSGNTFLAVKDSKNDIKVFTDKTTNDASYAPKSDFNELKQGVINNEQTTSAALNDLNTRVNQLSSVDMGNYATTATTEAIKSDISGLKTSVGANETKIRALEDNLSLYVPTSRTINGTALTSNITITKVESAITSTNVNGYTVAKSVPSDAVFTDTTYDDVTTSTRGLMTAADKTKLDGIASGATKYSHPTFMAKTSGFYKIAVNNEGHVTGTTNVTESDITGLIGTPSLTGHNHDDRYYTETEVNTKLETINGKMVTGATMSSTATTPSVDNNVLTIPTVAGKPGTDAGFGTPTASIDSNTGMPTVTVTASGPDTAKVFDFKFKNLKGKDGTNGSDGRDGTSASITGATATVTTLDAGNDATVTVGNTGSEFSRGFNFTFGIPKGEKGEPGQTGPAGPSAKATTNNGRRYLMGLSSTTGNITGATTSGSCYMSGGCLYSQNKEVLTAVTVSNHYSPSTHGYFLHAKSRGKNVKTPLTDISVDNKGHIVGGYCTSEEVAFLSDLEEYVPTGRTVNGKTLSQDIAIDSVASATTAESATTASSASSVAWSNVKNAPSFASSDHTHSEYVKKTGDTMSGTLYINNDKLSIDNYGGEALTIIGQSVFDGDVRISNGVLNVTGTTYLSGGTSITGDTTVNGKVSASSGFFQTSDRRLKNFQGDIEVDFDKLKSIPKKYFYWNMDSKKSKLEIGTSAQEVMEVYPELVSINEAGMLSVAYDKLSVIALKAVDELHEENVALKEKNDELERRLRAIEEKLGI